MTKTTIKENRLNIRCLTYVRQLLDKAAAYAHVSISEFVLTHALSSAELIIKEHESITLQPVDFQDFLTALDKPLQVNAALNRAFNRHSLQVKRGYLMLSSLMTERLIRKSLTVVGIVVDAKDDSAAAFSPFWICFATG